MMLVANSLHCQSALVQPKKHEKSELTVARQWIDAALHAVKQDGQGPTVHARNLFHLTAAMYDAWAVYEPDAKPYFLGNTVGEFHVDFDGFEYSGTNIDSAQKVTICYAAYRFLELRFGLYGSKNRTFDRFHEICDANNVNLSDRSTDYSNGSPSALGNYIGAIIFEFGQQDGSGEGNGYEPQQYQPVNGTMDPSKRGVGSLRNPNRWQPLDVNEYVKEKGSDKTLPFWNYLFVADQTVFTTPEWGNVVPFSLTEEDMVIKERDGEWKVYLDPGSPPLITDDPNASSSKNYKWGFTLNAIWSGLLDPADSVRIDISPGSIGSVTALPNSFDDFDQFYNVEQGGVLKTKPIEKNPFTGKPYEENVVLRADYLRVIAEYWVDAINTYSPPGHWIDLLSMTSYDPNFERKWQGKGESLSQLDWDIKAYFTMAGAMHDAGIACWGIKGYYDYVRPFTAIRYMAGKGQSSDSLLPNYHPHGIPLVKGHIELVKNDDPLVGENLENLNAIKILAWRGPDVVNDPFEESAGVGWILGENWWPYQRYSFATPTFAGYVSGHSTFSPCGAEVLTQITGSPFFPGGLHTFTAKKNEFLEFENGPTEDVTLQWAKYHDAAAETCLSRIHGGIHPPCDDIPARKIGIEVAHKAIKKAESYFVE
ncbi:MAG: hypothetical protein GC178_01755 [Flavobacteriales bacterium]|nr:hypothetical protein [Flavobacteriales bacterium]